MPNLHSRRCLHLLYWAGRRAISWWTRWSPRPL